MWWGNGYPEAQKEMWDMGGDSAVKLKLESESTQGERVESEARAVMSRQVEFPVQQPLIWSFRLPGPTNSRKPAQHPEPR